MASSGPSSRKIMRMDDAKDVDKSDKELEAKVVEISDIQNNLEELTDKASSEILQIETKYNKLRKPFYDKRAVIIETIPKFWLTTLKNHPKLCSLVLDKDVEECLTYLKNLDVEEFGNGELGYRLTFKFGEENPFFDNLELTKELELLPESEKEKFKSITTRIQWKEGKDLSGKEDFTFFAWLNDNSSEDDAAAEVIKDELWSNPIHYFLMDEEFLGEGESEEEEEEAEDEDQEEWDTFSDGEVGELELEVGRQEEVKDEEEETDEELE